MRKNGKSERKPKSRRSNPNHLPEMKAPEKTIRLLEYLKKHTDKDHPIKAVKDIREIFQDRGWHFGCDNALRDLVQVIADAYNLDANQHPLAQSEWRIVYDGYVNLYGEENEELAGEDDFDKSGADRGSFRNLYYVPEFSYEEIDALVEAVQLSPTLNSEETERIVSILENQFTSEYYRKGARNICKIHARESCDRNLLRENLVTIQQAIAEGVQISYRFNGYTRDKKLAPMGDYKRYASPYYIVANDGRYYLMAAMDKYKDRGTYIIRIDLMTEVEIPERHEKAGKSRIPAISKKEVVGLQPEWEKDFPMRHINMSYGQPISIKMRIRNEKEEDGHTPKEPVYTFLHDYFGDTYQYMGEDKSDVDYDIVKVRCTRFGMENFAVQFADKVEVLEPQELREGIRKRVQKLAEKYQ